MSLNTSVSLSPQPGTGVVGVIDGGFGNIRSVQRMIEAVGGKAQIISDPNDLGDCAKLVLPGVGAFDAGMRALHQGGWVAPLELAVQQQHKPILGICLGMQLFCRRSDEGNSAGLGWIDADVRRFDLSAYPALRVPHMGWATTSYRTPNPLHDPAEKLPRYYYVHKFHAVCDDEADILCTGQYGIEFVAGVHRGNVIGVQFHPEKSHRFGMSVFRHFLGLPC